MKRCVGLYKPPAKVLMDEAEKTPKKITDELCQEHDHHQRNGRNELPLLSRQLAYLLAQITDGSARAIVRCEDTENGFHIWRRVGAQLALPERAKDTRLLNEILSFGLRPDHLEGDLNDFLIVKSRPEKRSGRPIDDDLLITLLMQKATGPLQQHLRLHIRSVTTFQHSLDIVYAYTKSKHLTDSTAPITAHASSQGAAPMDIGALKGKDKGWKGIRWKRNDRKET